MFNKCMSDIDKRKNTIKLWSIGILLILAFLGSGLGVYAYENHGTVWLSFDETKEEGVEYVLTLNEVRGIITWKTPIAVRYGNGKNFYDIAKTDDVTFYEYYLNDDDYPEIVVKGTSEYVVIVYVLQKVRGEWRIIPNTGESGGALHPAPAFRGHDVSFPNIDGKGWREVEESFHIGYSNAQDEIWHTWYRYDPTMQAFVFIEKNKVPVKDENNLFDEIDVDPIMIRKSPNFTW